MLIKKWIDPWLEKEIHKTSLWLKMSFYKEKQRWEIQMLMYVKTLGELDWLAMVLAKVSQLGWWETSTSSSPLQLVELGIVCMVDYGGSWMNTISKANWVSRIVLTIRLFFQTFWEKIFKTSQIIERSCLQLSKLILSCFHRSQYIFCYAIHGWTCVSRMDKG